MEIKYTVITVDKEGKEQVQAYKASWKSVEGFLRIWKAGADPNHLNDIKIHQEIEKWAK